MNNEEYENVNEIDMECAAPDDDDFGGPVKVISADIDANNTLQIRKNFGSDQPVANPNVIDMECNCCDDDDDFVIDDDEDSMIITDTDAPEINLDQPTTAQKTGIILDFGDDEPVIEKPIVVQVKEEPEPELVIEEKKEKKIPGSVEDDYWKKLQKKHAATNIKGAYNTHFHFAGDPKKEQDMFNHDMGSAKGAALSAGLPTMNASGGIDHGSGVSGNVSGTAGGGEGCCEDYKKLYEDLLVITGFDVVPNDDNTFTLKDTCGMNKDISCNSRNEVIDNLRPYIDDCFIFPLQIATGEKFTDYADWCNWYNDEMQQKYPNCRDDIRYCDLLANHINEF